MIVAAFLLASWLGCVIAASPWSDKKGRRFWIVLGAAIQIVGTVICAASFSSGQLIGGRVVIVSIRIERRNGLWDLLDCRELEMDL
jgi:MFS family permease